jgi:hypothetical protein
MQGPLLEAHEVNEEQEPPPITLESTYATLTELSESFQVFAGFKLLANASLPSTCHTQHALLVHTVDSTVTWGKGVSVC